MVYHFMDRYSQVGANPHRPRGVFDRARPYQHPRNRCIDGYGYVISSHCRVTPHTIQAVVLGLLRTIRLVLSKVGLLEVLQTIRFTHALCPTSLCSAADPDMNTELVAHGYSNALSGLFGGE